MSASLLLLTASARAHVPVVYVTAPDEDWCGVIDAALGGDIIMLAPGTYLGPCAIEGKPSDPIGESTFVQSLDPSDPALFVAGTGDHVLSLTGVRIVLLQLSFAALPAGVDAVHVGNADEMWVRYCWFDGIGGAAIRQTADVGDVTFENNELVDVGTIAALGCPAGTCATDLALVEDNLVVGAGEGISVLSPSVATIRDNVLLGVGGTGILVSGGDATLEGNLVEAAGTAVVVTSASALLRSQILLAPTGIVADGAHGDVHIVGNTVVSSGGSPLVLDGWGPGTGLRLADNAVDAPLPDLHGAEAAGNVACVPAEVCFTDPLGWDFYPGPASPLRGAGAPDGELLSDWCGKVRGASPTPGAFEAFGEVSYGAVPKLAKDDFVCTPLEEPPGTTGEPPPTDTDPPPTELPDVPTGPGSSGGCGVAPVGARGAVVVAVALLAARRRRPLR